MDNCIADINILYLGFFGGGLGESVTVSNRLGDLIERVICKSDYGGTPQTLFELSSTVFLVKADDHLVEQTIIRRRHLAVKTRRISVDHTHKMCHACGTRGPGRPPTKAAEDPSATLHLNGFHHMSISFFL